jgi:hypothetical protein
MLIQFWTAFTESLNTRGGTIAVLFISTAVLGVAVMHIVHHGDEGPAANILIGTFSNFTGALLLALTSSRGHERTRREDLESIDTARGSVSHEER